MNWTVNRIAHMQASALGLDDAGKTELHRASRNIVMKNVVPSTTDEADSRGTRLLDDESAAAVLLLLPLARLAMDVRGLRDIANGFFAFRLNENITQIGYAIAKAKEGKSVKLVITLQLHAETRQLKPTSAFKIEGEEPSGDVAKLLNANRKAFLSELATIEVAASDILHTFLS